MTVRLPLNTSNLKWVAVGHLGEHRASAVAVSGEAHVEWDPPTYPRAKTPVTPCAHTREHLLDFHRFRRRRQRDKRSVTRADDESLGDKSLDDGRARRARQAATSDTRARQSVATPASPGTRPGCVRAGRQTAAAAPLLISAASDSSGASLFLSSFSA
jgi:hypothetical protein